MTEKQEIKDTVASATFYDQPCVYKVFLSSLLSSYDEFIKDGNITAEVTSSKYSLLHFPKEIEAFDLRKKREVRIPSHVLGACAMHDTFSTPIAMTIPLPPVGSSRIINPLISPWFKNISNMYRYIQADAIWVVHVPCPLGTAVILRADAPEIDETTTTRGVVWKPQGVNTIAFSVPWNSDVSVVPMDLGRPGQSGLSLKITNIASNTTETVQETLSVVVWCYVHNASFTAYMPVDPTKGEEIKGLNFMPIKLPPPPDEIKPARDIFARIEQIEQLTIKNNQSGLTTHSANQDINAEGLAELDQNIETNQIPEIVLEPPTEGKLPRPQVPRPGTTATKEEQTSIVSSRWFLFGNYTLKAADVGKLVSLKIDPLQVGKPGEGIRLAFERNLWYSGPRHIGYTQTLQLRIQISRPQQVAGVVEIIDSTLPLSSRYLVSFGDNVIIPITPDVFVSPKETRLRDANNAWMRTFNAEHTVMYRLLGLNRNADSKDVVMTILIRNGDTQFSAPTKPIGSIPVSLERFSNFMFDLCSDAEENKDNKNNDLIKLSNDLLVTHSDNGYYSVHDNEYHSPSSNRFSGNTFAPPAAGDFEYGEANNGGASEEVLDQDQFWTLAYDGEVEVGKPIAIPLNLSVIDDKLGDGTTNQITQKFERFAQVIPRSAGAFGPRIGQYKIVARLPTDIAADIAHISLPGDMVDEVAAKAFGLGSILGLATSAISSIGGPILSGLLTTVRDGIGGLVGSILGGKPSTNNNDSINPSNSPTAIVGGIDIARFVNFIKPILTNEKTDPVFGSLLVELLRVISQTPSTRAPLNKIQIQVYLRMDDVNVERTTSDRTITPLTQGIKNVVYIPHTAYKSIIRRFLSDERILNKETIQHANFVKFIQIIFDDDLINYRNEGVILQDVLDQHVLPGKFDQILNEFKSSPY